MREYLVTLLISAALCYLITPIVRTQAIRFGAVAGIRERDIHSTPTARWGGVAMWAAMALTFLIVSNLPLVGKSIGHEAQGIFLAATSIVLLGMADDRFELDALTKLAGQVFTAGILLLYGIQILWLPINGVITLPPSIGQLLTVLIVLVVINAVNFIDGMDGLAAGVVAISGIAFFAFAYLLAVDYGFSRAGAPSLITAVLIGICLGFLPHNLSPAKIFMGDSGSMLLGLLLSVSAITLTGNRPKRVFVISIPDWGITPFASGRDRKEIANEIDAYNLVCEKNAKAEGANFINITDAYRIDGAKPDYLSVDGLHPSKLEYTKWAIKLTQQITNIFASGG